MWRNEIKDNVTIMRKNSSNTNIKKLSGIILSAMLIGGLIAGCGDKVDVNSNSETEVKAEVMTTAKYRQL